MIERPERLRDLRQRLRRAPVVALLGPRQCGKTTLARQFLAGNSPNYFDLEDPVSLARLDEPQTVLAPLRGLVVIDEVQRREEIFPVLRVLVDRPRNAARYLILGSASPALIRQASESLAGRIELVEMAGFSVKEVGATSMSRLWRRGGFPRSFLARSEAASLEWRRQFVRAVIERDLPALGVAVPAQALMRFWSMLAHGSGAIWNAAEPARSLGISEPTVRRYLDLLSGLFMVRQLLPWHANMTKRQVKSPKIYVRDSGLLHVLLGITDERTLLKHPKLGASWEGFVIEELIKTYAPDQVYFWATHQGAELDLLMIKQGKRLGFEVKRSDAPAMTPSMRNALDGLGLDRLTVVYPGERAYSLAQNVRVLPLTAALEGTNRRRTSRSREADTIVTFVRS